jgi:hypothetical protein
MPAISERVLPSYLSREGLSMNFSDPWIQSDFLISNEQQRFITEQHEFALGVNDVFNDLYPHYLILTPIAYPEKKLSASEIKDGLIQDRIKLKQDLALFEEKFRPYSFLISEAQRVLEASPHRRKFNIRNHLIPAFDDDDYKEKLGDQNPKGLIAVSSGYNGRITWNITAKGGESYAPPIFPNPRLAYALRHTFFLLHESVHMISTKPIEFKGEELFGKRGFCSLHANLDGSIMERQNYDLNEKVTSFFAFNFLKQTVFGEDIDLQAFEKTKAGSSYAEIKTLADAVGLEEFSRFYFNGDFNSFYMAVKKVYEESNPKEANKIKALFNKFSDVNL